MKLKGRLCSTGHDTGVVQRAPLRRVLRLAWPRGRRHVRRRGVTCFGPRDQAPRDVRRERRVMMGTHVVPRLPMPVMDPGSAAASLLLLLAGALTGRRRKGGVTLKRGVS